MGEPTVAWAHTGDLTKTEGDRLFSSGGGGTSLRFWLKEGTSRQVVFIDGDDDGFRTKEHSLTINGTFGNAFTCIQGIPGLDNGRGCPLCAMAVRRKGHRDAGGAYGVAYFTVADLTPYTNREGKVFPITVMLLPCKKEMLAKFSTMRKEMFGGTLVGRQFLAMRSAPVPGQQGDAKTPRIGDNWQQVAQVPLMQLPAAPGQQPRIVPNIPDPRTGQLAVPFNYLEILAPKSFEELAQLAAEIERGGGTTATEQPVPYGPPPAGAAPAPQPVPYGGVPAPAAQPAPFAPQPAPFAPQPAPFAARTAVAPAPFAAPAGQPVPYGAQPAGQPVPVGYPTPAPAAPRPAGGFGHPGDPGV